MSCDVGCGYSSDLALLWLWCRPSATALIRPLAWELPYAAGVALKRKNIYNILHIIIYTYTSLYMHLTYHDIYTYVIICTYYTTYYIYILLMRKQKLRGSYLSRTHIGKVAVWESSYTNYCFVFGFLFFFFSIFSVPHKRTKQ